MTTSAGDTTRCSESRVSGTNTATQYGMSGVLVSGGANSTDWAGRAVGSVQSVSRMSSPAVKRGIPSAGSWQQYFSSAVHWNVDWAELAELGRLATQVYSPTSVRRQISSSSPLLCAGCTTRKVPRGDHCRRCKVFEAVFSEQLCATSRPENSTTTRPSLWSSWPGPLPSPAATGAASAHSPAAVAEAGSLHWCGSSSLPGSWTSPWEPAPAGTNSTALTFRPTPAGANSAALAFRPDSDNPASSLLEPRASPAAGAASAPSPIAGAAPGAIPPLFDPFGRPVAIASLLPSGLHEAALADGNGGDWFAQSNTGAPSSISSVSDCSCVPVRATSVTGNASRNGPGLASYVSSSTSSKSLATTSPPPSGPASEKPPAAAAASELPPAAAP
mmetsp:Transcript_3072/g.8226  ORF Transcript_3072/g.8226 Transcript_3072/m.8226 type:complete len:388 (+) Transcript_3072:1432-2595(+)